MIENRSVGKDDVILGAALPFPTLSLVPVGRQLTGAERTSTATAEETDIDAVEVPLPGNDALEFSRGVTDLDAVGKEGGAHTDPKVGRRQPSQVISTSVCMSPPRAACVTASAPVDHILASASPVVAPEHVLLSSRLTLEIQSW